MTHSTLLYLYGIGPGAEVRVECGGGGSIVVVVVDEGDGRGGRF